MRHLSSNTLKSIVRLSSQFRQECEASSPGWYTLEELMQEEFTDTPAQIQLMKLVSGLADRQLAELETLMGIGRGDCQPYEWDEAFQYTLEDLNTDTPENRTGEVEYIVYNTGLSDYLLNAMRLLKIH